MSTRSNGGRISLIRNSGTARSIIDIGSHVPDEEEKVLTATKEHEVVRRRVEIWLNSMRRELSELNDTPKGDDTKGAGGKFETVEVILDLY